MTLSFSCHPDLTWSVTSHVMYVIITALSRSSCQSYHSVASFPLSKSHFFSFNKHEHHSILLLQLPNIMQCITNEYSSKQSCFTESNPIRHFNQLSLLYLSLWEKQGISLSLSLSAFSLFLWIWMLIISPPPHIAWELMDSLLMMLELELEKSPSFMLEVSENIFDDRPSIPILSHGDLSGVL